AESAPTPIAVDWQEQALEQARAHGQRLQQPLVELIDQCLAQDPRPAYQLPPPERRYGACFWDVDVRWHYPQPDRIRVLEVVPAASTY
ncbi:tRNA (N6-threonylcarbamoyladenosine(37)-N6)-methyltransferase TrmO, partial [Pseudomonas sp. CrR25]|nr:tRNA (N6-threonylcarbamoyladenosine(37)-N6)-methyltransferase TrmO [Pseudomonas sp. CrR25]